LIDSEDGPLGREDWFLERGREIAGSGVFKAFGLDPESAAPADVATIAAYAAAIAVHHTAGASLGQLISWTDACLSRGIDFAVDATRAAYAHFRAGSRAEGFEWDPFPAYVSFLVWIEHRDQRDDREDALQRLQNRWMLTEEDASFVVDAARRWSQLSSESYCARYGSITELTSRQEVRDALEGLGSAAGRSGPLRALVTDVALARVLQGDPHADAAENLRGLNEDLEARAAALTPIEAMLLRRPDVPARVLGWARHRQSMYHAHVLRSSAGDTMAVMNGVCERVDDETLVPDWIDDHIFNGRYLAGINNGGPTAHAWVLVRDIADFASLQLDFDLEPSADPRALPPSFALYWRDETRAADDWSWVSLLIQDHPVSWGWLAVAAITRTVRVDVLTLGADNKLQLVRGALISLSEETVASFVNGFPEPPPYVAHGLARMAREHVIGGFQAAERAKSYDILELTSEEGADDDLRAARRDVLDAEAERAERIWALKSPDETRVETSWKRFRELQAWRDGASPAARIDPEAWLRSTARGIATTTRAIVHMMVTDDGLELLWTSEGGAHRDAVFTSAPVSPLLRSLEPWSRMASLRPSAEVDPISDMLREARPVAEALGQLAEDRGFDHLVVVPWRGLHSVPWGAVTLSDGMRLSQHVRVTHAPALRMLRCDAPGGLSEGEAVAIAVHGNTLRRADAEVELVAQVHGGQALRDGATADEIIEAMSAASIVHIAGHAETGPHPLAASLLGGHLPLEPGKVTSAARVHADADLNRCNIVVVNACNSGRYSAPVRAFENHTGFDTACLCAGATAVISTLWPVNDFVATIVGTTIHWEIAAGQSPYEALDSAVGIARDGQGAKGVPVGLAALLDDGLDTDWRGNLDQAAASLQHPYWWAAWQISGADWLFDADAARI
jgi:hypothetical protein